MPTSTRSTVVFSDFRGGEFDQKGPWQSPLNTWTGTNMHVYTTGELGVRAGVINRTPAGVANGTVLGFGTTGVSTRDAWFVQGTALRRFSINAGDNLATVTGAFGGTSTDVIDSFPDTTGTFLTSKQLGGTYFYDAVGDTNTLLTGSPEAAAVVRYGDRIIVGNIEGSNSFRVRFSDALNFNSWPAGNFVDIGDGWHVSGLAVQRQALLISKQTGFYLLTGVPGNGAVVRKLYSGPGPLWSHEQGLDNADTLTHQVVNFMYPAEFNGSQDKRWADNLNWIGDINQGSEAPAKRGVSPLTGAESGFVVVSSGLSGNGLMEVRSGVPTYHQFGVSVGGYTAKRGSEAYVPLVEPGSVSTPPAFYLWNPYADSPGIEGGDQMRAGDDSSTALTGEFTTAEWYAEDGDEFYVRSVIVDFRTWNTGSATTNHFDLNVDCLRRYNGTSPQSSTTRSFDQDPTESDVAGTIHRRIYGFGEQGPGNGFQLVFTNCRGMAVQRIEVVIDRSNARV